MNSIKYNLPWIMSMLVILLIGMGIGYRHYDISAQLQRHENALVQYANAINSLAQHHAPKIPKDE